MVPPACCTQVPSTHAVPCPWRLCGGDAETFVQPQPPGEFEVGAVKHSSLFLQQQVASSGTFFCHLLFVVVVEHNWKVAQQHLGLLISPRNCCRWGLFWPTLKYPLTFGISNPKNLLQPHSHSAKLEPLAELHERLCASAAPRYQCFWSFSPKENQEVLQHGAGRDTAGGPISFGTFQRMVLQAALGPGPRGQVDAHITDPCSQSESLGAGGTPQLAARSRPPGCGLCWEGLGMLGHPQGLQGAGSFQHPQLPCSTTTILGYYYSSKLAH